MTTEKQIKANKQNALVSTGPVTPGGKALVAQNAVKHGIFAKDLIISAGDGKEDEQEYRELLDGIILSLNPSGQMECLLVEKIAVDFWRLRRVLRFESGSIRKVLDMAISDYYNKVDWQGIKEHKTDEELDEKIAEYQTSEGNHHQKQIDELEQSKLKNKYAEEVAIKTSSLPAGDTYEKVIKYEKAVQRSILQNLALLKRLQSMR
ncbi:MAG: hypothetical protein UV05_C0004G0004 [candidate division CPR1 bacterium GW2011_GWA2_42_17]|uniref:Uncharacterized protein n=1 Tax=candidate division CPR1 bacterium GW2011_GWA2_42_17 TaxID=1618341 RepID=A0A0G0Z7E0_9BACT|nr:MAG: hypothetical protein UV05_C0004G0004 [candidate division CPR1 bacterium GW2011_GWA2_42_17]